MRNISVRAIRALALVAILAVPTAAAFADSGDGPQFDLPQPVPMTGPATTALAAAPLTHDVDNAVEPSFSGRPAVVALGGGDFLPVDGDAAGLQTANSAPAGFGTDTVTLAAQSAGVSHYAQR